MGGEFSRPGTRHFTIESRSGKSINFLESVSLRYFLLSSSFSSLLLIKLNLLFQIIESKRSTIILG